MTDEQLEKFVKERYEERTAFEVRPACSLAAYVNLPQNLYRCAVGAVWLALSSECFDIPNWRHGRATRALATRMQASSASKACSLTTRIRSFG